MASLLSDAVMYGLVSAIARSIALITFPLLAWHLSLSDFGLVDIVNSVSALAATMVVFGQDSAVARYVHKLDSAEQRLEMLAQACAMQFSLAVAFAAAGMVFAENVARIVAYPAVDGTLIRMVLLLVPLQVLVNFSQNLLKWTRRRREFSLVSLGGTAIHLVGLLVAVCGFGCGVQGIVAITLVSRAAVAIAGVWTVRQLLRPPRSLNYVTPLFKYAVPYGISCTLAAAVPVTERWLVDFSLGPEDVGLYAGAVRIASVVSLLAGAFEMAWGPFHLAIHRDDHAQRTFNVILSSVTVALCVFSLCIGAAAPWLTVLLASAKFEGSAVAIFPLCLAVAARAIGAVLSVGIGIAMRPRLALGSEVLGTLTTLAAISLLTPALGLIGTALGVLAGQVAGAAAGYAAAHRVHPLAWDLRAPAACLAATATGGGLGIALGAVHARPWDAAVFASTAAALLTATVMAYCRRRRVGGDMSGWIRLLREWPRRH